MKKKVSKEEISNIHQFCISHRVIHYDVRLELVDHLASSIEAMWEQEPSIIFWDALNKIYLSYGPTGFRKLMYEKEKVVEKNTNKGYTKLLRSFFHWPNILLLFTVIFSFLFFFSFYDMGHPIIPAIFLGISILFLIGFNIYILRFYFKRRKSIIYPLLSTQEPRYLPGILVQYPIIYIIIGYLSGNQTSIKDLENPSIFIVFSILIIINFIFDLARLKYGKDIYSKAKSLYPEAFKA